MTRDEYAKRKRAIKWLSSFVEITPCAFCGRCMLAGVCCTKALKESKKQVRKRNNARR